MKAAAPIVAGYLDSLLTGQPRLPASPSAHLNALRSEAVDRVGVLTVPTVRDEDWRFTDISPLTKMSFRPAQAWAPRSYAGADTFHLPEAGHRLVFVDGVFAPELSLGHAGGPLVAVDLSTGAAPHAEVIERHLGRHASFHDHLFNALNTAMLHDGALVIVPPDVAIADPIHLVFVATQKGMASHPRTLVVAGSGSAITLVEDYVTLENEAYFTNAVTEIALADNARVDHVRVQRDSANAFHIATCAVALERGSRYHTVHVALGARISRYDLGVLQAAGDGGCTIDGLALIGGRQLADTHTSIDHAMPDGMSRQRHKCIVGGAAHAVFNGKILVRRDAQRTDSAQSSRNLLLSPRASVDTKPQLEIFADDVKCAHGATVGQLDSEAVFYLMSRGLSETAARNLLTYAFGAEIIECVPVASLRRVLEETVLEQTANAP